MKKLVLSTLSLLFTTCLSAQNANPSNFQKMVDFLPPAPNASAIIKHGEISLNKNTGSPTINIPLFAAKGTKLSAGVSIGYSSTGLKVDEIASRVGMGWALNAGGVVTRTVRGWADEKTTRLVPPFPAAGYNCGTYALLSQVASSNNNSGYDAEPDLFNFNMNGNSGTFVLDENQQAVLIPAQKYKVAKDFSINAPWNFKITATDGIMYYFGGPSATEKTKRNNTCGKLFDQYLPSAWYLTKIEHPNGELINLTYTALTYSYETGISETLNWADINGYCSVIPPNTTCVNLVSTQGVLLNSIYNANNAVNFTYTASRLDCGDKLVSSITQVVNGQTAAVFNLTYNEQRANMTYAGQSYSGTDYTPYLTELKESSPDLVFNKIHKFIYKEPEGRAPRLSFSQDHWGYFNGKPNNSFIPTPTDPILLQRFPTAIANREPDPVYSVKGMLTKIVYPTGGIDNIDYEANEVQNSSEFQTDHEYNCSVNGTGWNTEVSRTMTFSIDREQIVELDITSSTSNITGYDALHMQSEVLVSGNSSTILSEAFFIQSGSPSSQFVRYLNPTWALPIGTYTLTYKAKGAAQTTIVKLKFKPQSFTSTLKNKTAAGVRVKRVMTGNPAETPVIKRYYYGKMSELDVSSMYQMPTPVYHKNYQVSTPPSYYLCNFTAMYSGSMINLFNFGTGPISYAYVVESIGENFEGGAIESKFYYGGDIEADLWWGLPMMGAPLSNLSSPLNGMLSEETIYKKPATGPVFPIKKTQYNYVLEETRARTRLYGYNINQRYVMWGGSVTPPALPCANVSSPLGDPDDSPINQYDAMRYYIDSWWVHLESQVETVYDENGQNPVTTTNNSYFDKEQHLQQTRSTVTNSLGQLINTTNEYPGDITGNQVYTDMVAKNIIAPVIHSKSDIINPSTVVLSEEWIDYSNTGNSNYVPTQIRKSVKGSPLEVEGTIDLYDSKGNILQFTNKVGIVSSIVWGYDYRYPVAQIVGTTYANAIAQLTGGSVTALQTMDGNTLRIEINKIRTNIPSASVTTYTYKPMAGVSSITDPNNRTNTYSYDSFNRLLTITDQDGYVVKKNEYVYTTPSASATLNVYFNQAVYQNFQCQTCVYTYTGNMVSYYIPFGKYYSLISQADADAKVATDIYGQEYANKNGKCVSSLLCTGPEYKAINCACEQGVKVCESSVNNGNGTYTLAYHYHFSDNTNSYTVNETIGCSGIDKKMINCTCETGVRVCDNSVNNGNGTYTLTYHYLFSDNTVSSSVVETISCSGQDKKIVNCVCETGLKLYTSSVYDKKGNMGCTAGMWLCYYHYRFSDGSYSATFSECNATDCID